jgi:DNA transposition AAA+ family ATPase
MTNINKQEITNLILAEKNSLGSFAAVANKCKISETALSQLMSGNYKAKGDDIWLKIASALNYSPSDWVFVPTTNYQMISQVLRDAKTESMFMAISHKAGSGKTSSLDTFAASDNSGTIYKIQCREWSRREFLKQLAQTLGINVTGGYVSVDRLGDQIIGFFKQRILQKPLLIIDEADKLKPSAIRFLIPLYNALEDMLAVVIAGTENLEKEIKRGVKYNAKGFDELDSRFGRVFIHLIGATRKDVAKICEANGIANPEKHKEIFKDCAPVKIMVQGQALEVVEDMRRLKRAIKRERLQLITAA